MSKYFKRSGLILTLIFFTLITYVGSGIPQQEAFGADRGVIAAASTTDPPIEASSIVATSELPALPMTTGEVPIEEILGLVDSLIKFVAKKNWLAVAIVSIILITSLLKTKVAGKLLGQVVPKKFIILVPLGLGVVVGILQAMIQGGWSEAIVTALSSGPTAVFIHEFIDRVIQNKRNE